jgi:subtilisin-like proprotein convertase family protein
MFMMLLLLSCLGKVASAAVVTVTIEGSGVGVVMGPALYCTQTCTETYPDKTALHLKAYPDPHSTFLGWRVNGEPHEGMLVIEQDTTVTAIFESTLSPDILERRYYYYEGEAKTFVYLSLDEIDVVSHREMWWAATPEERTRMAQNMEQLFHPQADYDSLQHLSSPEPVTKEQLLNALSSIQALPYINYASPVFYRTPDKETGKTFGRKVLTDEIMVDFPVEYPEEQILEIENEYGLVRLEASSYFPNEFVYQAPSPLEALEIANTLYESGKVQLATPNWIVELHLQSLPDDSLFRDHQWYLRNTGQYSGNTGEDIHLFQTDDSSVWETYHVNGEGMTIAILDAGLETTHEDLRSASSMHYDFVEMDTNPIQDMCPCDDPEKCKENYGIDCDEKSHVSLHHAQNYARHGTSVAGLAAAVSDSKGICGVAPAAQLVGFRVKDEILKKSAKKDKLAKAFLQHHSSIQIYNYSMSLSHLEESPDSWLSIETGARDLGKVYVMAGVNCEGFCRGSSAYSLQNSRYTIAVGASTNTGTHNSKTEQGANIVINAPGDRGNMTTTDANNGYTYTFGDTSAATPLVSGVVALMLDANDALTPQAVQHILITTADKNPGWDGTANTAGYEHSYQYGFGRVNALAAVQQAVEWRDDEYAFPEEQVIDWTDANSKQEIAIEAHLRIEYVEVEFTALNHAYNALNITLRSPNNGSQSRLAKWDGDFPQTFLQYNRWIFGSVRHFGESSSGTWTLDVTDHNGEPVADYTWRLKIYGTPMEDCQWTIDMPGGTLTSSQEDQETGTIRMVYFVDEPDYETRVDPFGHYYSTISLSYEGVSWETPVLFTPQKAQGTGQFLDPSHEETMVFTINWIIYSVYHGHWKNLNYYVIYKPGATQPEIWYNDTLWPAGPIDNDFTGNEGHGIHFAHPPIIQGNTVSLDLLMSGSVPECQVHHLATVTLRVPRDVFAYGNYLK